MIRCFVSVWVQPNCHGCTGATHGVEVGVGTGVTFGIAIGVETGTVGLVLGSQVQLIVVFLEWFWQVVVQVWETWCEPVLMWLMGHQAQHHCI